MRFVIHGILVPDTANTVCCAPIGIHKSEHQIRSVEDWFTYPIRFSVYKGALAGAAISGDFHAQHVYCKGYHDGAESGRFHGHLDGVQEALSIEQHTCELEEQLRDANHQALVEPFHGNAGRKK